MDDLHLYGGKTWLGGQSEHELGERALRADQSGSQIAESDEILRVLDGHDALVGGQAQRSDALDVGLGFLAAPWANEAEPKGVCARTHRHDVRVAIRALKGRDCDSEGGADVSDDEHLGHRDRERQRETERERVGGCERGLGVEEMERETEGARALARWPRRRTCRGTRRGT
jgi:hypothetical protein